MAHKSMLPPGFITGRSVRVTFDDSDGKQQTPTESQTTHHTTGTIPQTTLSTDTHDPHPLPSHELDIPGQEESDYSSYEIPNKRTPPPSFPLFTDNYRNSPLLDEALKRDIAWAVCSAVGDKCLDETISEEDRSELHGVGELNYDADEDIPVTMRQVPPNKKRKRNPTTCETASESYHGEDEFTGIQDSSEDDSASSSYNSDDLHVTDSQVMANKTAESRAELIDQLLKQKGYNRLVRPGEDSHTPTPVTIDVMVHMISSISEINMEFATDIYYRQRWRDSRLAFEDFNKTLNLGYSRIESIWYPDIYFPSLKGGYRHDLTSPNILLRLYPDGTVLYSQRLALIMACSMDLQKFPLDKQRCRLDFMSYGYTVEELTISWDGQSNISLNNNITLPDFELDGYKLGDCTEIFSTGTYGCVFVELKFTRQFGHYLTGTYLPTMLIIVLSWIGFWIDYKSTPSRISLGLLTVLAVTTQSTSIQAELPRVSYVKSIDVWMAICMVFVAGALLEFAIVNVIARKDSEKILTKRAMRLSTASSTASTQELVYTEKNHRKRVSWGKTQESAHENYTDSSENRGCLKTDESYALRIDKLSRILFPVLFFLTTMIYGLSVHLHAYPEE
ncbi:glycine receptor subunit alpha-2-like [Liolophura sinensis]|uniref:glycine receptor subunit alpha-2-like n=1 Tax=Liolophura sinensis TaxID=3198878 RepID=UPI003158BFA0